MMATYFNTNGDGGGGSEIQTDSLQTLYLMNPSYSAYASDNTNQHHPEAPPTGPNMLLLNPGNLPHAPTLSAYHHNQHFVGIPLAGGGPSNNPDDPTRSLHEIPTSLQGLVPRLQYNHWNSMDPATSTHGSQAAAHLPTAVAVSSAGGVELGFRRRSVVASALQQQQQQQQGLSLSLSPHDQNNNNNNNSYSGQRAQGQVTVVSSGNACVGDDIRMSRGSPASMSNGVGVPGVHQSVILGSKYLKAAQQLLDEVVNVGDAMKGVDRITKTEKSKGADAASCVVGGEGSSGVACGGSGGGETSNGKRGAELTTAQRQELQMKKAKLLNMVEEVEQRYRQYHNEMQMVVTPFERAAGLGSAKSYTALALQTISKQFRCLKDAIASQIKATSKTLGEDDCHLLSAKVEGTAAGSRLKFVDHQLRQQRALQQLGMIQHNAWRPQRGLPERAVSVLRAWLFEHFLHPYPKDSDKHILAKQTGLTRSQVSNWFINARVRLWKPMVEEMYLEEIKSQDQNNSNGCESNHNNMIGSTSTHEHNHKDMISSSKSNAAQQQPSLDNSSTGGIMTRIDQQHVQAGGTTKSPRNHHQNLLPHHPTNNMGISNNSTTMSPAAASLHTMPQGFSLIGSPDIDPMDPRSPKKQRSMDMQNSPSSILSMDMEMKPAVGHDHHGRRSDHLGVLKYGAGQHNDHQTQSFMTSQNHDHGFGAYQIGDHLGRFDVTDQLAQRFHGNGVSLTLGLPHNETSNLPFSGAPHHHQQQQQQNFMSGQSMQLGRRLDMGGGTGEADFVGINSGAAQPTHTTSGAYDHNMDMQNRKRFAAPLLPDFVV